MLIAILLVLTAVVLERRSRNIRNGVVGYSGVPIINWIAGTTDYNSTKNWPVGYLSSRETEIEVIGEDGASLGFFPRGTEVKYRLGDNGSVEVEIGESRGFVPLGSIADNLESVVPADTLYVRTAVNLVDESGNLTEHLAEKGSAVEITGYDQLLPDGSINMYRVKSGEAEGYIRLQYIAGTYEEAAENYDHNGAYETHLGRGDSYGGGSADNLDYFPREKGYFEDNIMPEECRTLYVCSWCVEDIDDYIELANSSGINAFVVDITDGTSVGYGGEVMQKYSPSAAANASNTVEEYQAAIKKIKDAGYYVIGRITTFNDSFFVQDHPECAVKDNNGEPLALNGAYWPSPYNRYAWQYKVDLAVEAINLMGFNEIQFDYVRFPDLTYKYEQDGTIDYGNEYGETKAQAIQRFLMYASDVIHDNGAYISADVFGESAYTYVTAYGQYWPAISTVVDVISGMPYPDHFGYTDTWRPWEHPYETLYEWGLSVVKRQEETSSPAKVRTWIQAYNAIRPPYNTYGPDEVLSEINGLRDAGLTDGYLTWNGVSSLDKYWQIADAFSQ